MINKTNRIPRHFIRESTATRLLKSYPRKGMEAPHAAILNLGMRLSEPGDCPLPRIGLLPLTRAIRKSRPGTDQTGQQGVYALGSTPFPPPGDIRRTDTYTQAQLGELRSKASPHILGFERKPYSQVIPYNLCASIGPGKGIGRRCSMGQIEVVLMQSDDEQIGILLLEKAKD